MGLELLENLIIILILWRVDVQPNNAVASLRCSKLSFERKPFIVRPCLESCLWDKETSLITEGQGRKAAEKHNREQGKCLQELSNASPPDTICIG